VTGKRTGEAATRQWPRGCPHGRRLYAISLAFSERSYRLRHPGMHEQSKIIRSRNSPSVCRGFRFARADDFSNEPNRSYSLNDSAKAKMASVSSGWGKSASVASASTNRGLGGRNTGSVYQASDRGKAFGRLDQRSHRFTRSHVHCGAQSPLTHPHLHRTACLLLAARLHLKRRTRGALRKLYPKWKMRVMRVDMTREGDTRRLRPARKRPTYRT